MSLLPPSPVERKGGAVLLHRRGPKSRRRAALCSPAYEPTSAERLATPPHAEVGASRSPLATALSRIPFCPMTPTHMGGLCHPPSDVAPTA